MLIRFSSLLAVVGLVLAPEGVLAQDVVDSTHTDSTRIAPGYLLEGVIVRVAQPALTTTGSSAVAVTMDSLSHVPAPTMEDVLRAMPLIQIRANSRGESQPALRGSEDRQIAVIVDGVPLTLGWDHRTDLSIIPLTAARSVTLTRGLPSVLYGPNTLGGVVEVDLHRTDGRTGRVEPVSVGMSLDHTGATNVSATGGSVVAGSDSEWVIRAGAGLQKRNDLALAGAAASAASIRPQYLSATPDRRLNSDARRVDGFFTARYRADAGTWAAVSTSAFDVERGVPPEAHQDAPRLWRYPVQRRLVTAFSGGTGSRATRFGTGDIEASLGIDLGHTRIDEFATEAYQTVVGGETDHDRTLTLRLLGEHTLGAARDLRAAFTFADVAHKEVLDPSERGSYRQRLWSLGTEAEWRVGPLRSTRVTLGVAMDGSDTPVSSDKPPLGTLWDYGARMGFTSLVRGGLAIHGGISRRARFPSLRELYSGALGRFEPNPGLRPEVLVGMEGGLTLRSGESELQAVAFHHRLSDGIVRTSITTADGEKKYKRINQDQVLGTGLELLAAGALGSVTFSGDLTLQSVHGVDASGQHVDLEYEPRTIGRLGLELPVGAGVRAAGTLRYVGLQRCENPEIGGLQPLASSRTGDLSLRRIFRHAGAGVPGNVDASIEMRNVTDAVVFDQCGLPQPGRTLRIQFRVW